MTVFDLVRPIDCPRAGPVDLGPRAGPGPDLKGQGKGRLSLALALKGRPWSALFCLSTI